MSFLIVGGAFVVAILAIVGLFFVIRQDQQAATPQPRAVAVAEQAAAATTGVPAAPIPTAPPGPTPVVQQPSIDAVPTMPIHKEEDYFPVSNGQLHEFSVQLNTLHEQAQELEHRLSILTEMIGRIERSQRGTMGLDDSLKGDMPSTLN